MGANNIRFSLQAPPSRPPTPPPPPPPRTTPSPRKSNSHEHRAAVVPAARAAPVLQHRGVHPDDGGHVLPRVPKRPRRRADAVQLRAPSARDHELTRLESLI